MNQIQNNILVENIIADEEQQFDGKLKLQTVFIKDNTLSKLDNTKINSFHPLKIQNEKKEAQLDNTQILVITQPINQEQIFSRITSSLIIINISNNKLNKIPECLIIAQQYLQELLLDNNNIKQIPIQIQCLTNLKKLSLAHNFIKTLPNQLNQLVNLEELILNNNQIDPLELPDTLPALRNLAIQNNFFTEIPLTISLLNNLTQISLEWFKYTNPQQSCYLIDNQCKNFIEKLKLLKEKLYLQGKSKIAFIQFIQFFSINPPILWMHDFVARNLLHISSLQQEVGVMRSLVQNCKDLLNETDKDQQTPLSLSLSQEKFLSVKILLALGANPRIGGGSYGSCLHLACAKLEFKIVKNLLQRGASVNVQDCSKNTPLHIVFYQWNQNASAAEQIAQLLMNNGAIPNTYNIQMYTPLHVAIVRQCFSAVKWILEYNQKKQYISKGKSIEEIQQILFNLQEKVGISGNGLLHLIARNFNLEILELLIQQYEIKEQLLYENFKGKKPQYLAQGNNLLAFKSILKFQHEYISDVFNQQKENLIKNDGFLAQKMALLSGQNHIQNLKQNFKQSSIQQKLFPNEQQAVYRQQAKANKPKSTKPLKSSTKAVLNNQFGTSFRSNQVKQKQNNIELEYEDIDFDLDILSEDQFESEDEICDENNILNTNKEEEEEDSDSIACIDENHDIDNNGYCNSCQQLKKNQKHKQKQVAQDVCATIGQVLYPDKDLSNINYNNNSTKILYSQDSSINHFPQQQQFNFNVKTLDASKGLGFFQGSQVSDFTLFSEQFMQKCFQIISKSDKDPNLLKENNLIGILEIHDLHTEFQKLKRIILNQNQNLHERLRVTNVLIAIHLKLSNVYSIYKQQPLHSHYYMINTFLTIEVINYLKNIDNNNYNNNLLNNTVLNVIKDILFTIIQNVNLNQDDLIIFMQIFKQVDLKDILQIEYLNNGDRKSNHQYLNNMNQTYQDYNLNKFELLESLFEQLLIVQSTKLLHAKQSINTSVMSNEEDSFISNSSESNEKQIIYDSKPTQKRKVVTAMIALKKSENNTDIQ